MIPPGPVLPSAFLRVPLAHRGYHDAGAGRAENSVPAFDAALSAGYGIELDVQLTRDGRAVVFHDATLDRMTAETGPVAARTTEDLSHIALCYGSGRIPTLIETLAQVAGKVPLLVEVKDTDGALGPDVGPLEQAVADALASYCGPVAVMSFNPHSVAALAALAPGVPRGLTTCAFDAADWELPAHRRAALAQIAAFDVTGAAFISHDARDLDRPRVTALKSKGTPILCWTIRSPKAESRARQVADTITFEGYAAPLS